jgi:hypothetical protein
MAESGVKHQKAINQSIEQCKFYFHCKIWVTVPSPLVPFTPGHIRHVYIELIMHLFIMSSLFISFQSFSFYRYEPRRAIVRQGHLPHSFYFILVYWIQHYVYLKLVNDLLQVSDFLRVLRFSPPIN